MMNSKFILLLLLLCSLGTSQNMATFKEKIEGAKAKTEQTLKQLFQRWDVSTFPNFLRSATMSHTSWEVLKVWTPYDGQTH